MTTFASAVQPSSLAVPSSSSPSLPRLVGGGLVAMMGVVILSIAVGNYVVGSSQAIGSSQAAMAHRLVAATPVLVAIGLLHLVVAVALARGRDLPRIAAVLASGLAALAAAASAAMFAAGVDPFNASGSGAAPTSGIAILVIAALLHGTAAVAAGSRPVEG
jgi:hypothetical protein